MLFGMATLSMCFTLVQDQMAAKFRMLGQKCKLLSCFKRESSDEEGADEDDGGEVARRASRTPVQPATTTRAAGTEVFERRRRMRVERLKFRWIRDQLSGKARRRRRSQSTSSSSGTDDGRLPSDSVFDDDVAMTTTSGTVLFRRRHGDYTRHI